MPNVTEHDVGFFHPLAREPVPRSAKPTSGSRAGAGAGGGKGSLVHCTLDRDEYGPALRTIIIFNKVCPDHRLRRYHSTSAKTRPLQEAGYFQKCRHGIKTSFD